MYKNCVFCLKFGKCQRECYEFEYDEFELDAEKWEKSGLKENANDYYN